MQLQDITKNQIIENSIEFNNSAWCERTESDELLGGSLDFNERYKWFVINFNGQCINVYKTFSSAIKRLEKLFEDHNLEITND